MTPATRARLQELVEQIDTTDGYFIVGYGYVYTDNFVHELADELRTLAACLAAEGEEEPPKYQPSFADVYAEGITMGQELTAKHLASAMRKVLPPALLDKVLAHLDPLTPFLAFLREPPVASQASPEERPGDAD